MVDENCELLFCRNDLQVPGRVAWVRGRFAGIAFSEPLDRKVVLRHVPVAAARAAPAQLFRRPSVKRHEMSDEDSRWVDGWMQSRQIDRPGE